MKYWIEISLIYGIDHVISCILHIHNSDNSVYTMNIITENKRENHTLQICNEYHYRKQMREPDPPDLYIEYIITTHLENNYYNECSAISADQTQKGACVFWRYTHLQH